MLNVFQFNKLSSQDSS